MEVRFDDRLSGHRYGFRGRGEVVAAHHIDEVIPAFECVESEVAGGRWAAGFVSYEAAPAFDDVLVVRSDDSGPSAIPLLWFALYDDRLDPGLVPQGEYGLSVWEAVEDRHQYMRSLARIRSHIQAGDTYQVNYTYQQSARWRGDTRGFYGDLLTAQSAAYGAYLDTGRFQILSASPELFFVREDDHIVCRPMKGTSARGRWPKEDRDLLSALLSSEKERAENVMIVDLIRNDLGRVARFGTVQVVQLIAAEQYETVWQLVSTVSAELLPATIPEVKGLHHNDLYTLFKDSKDNLRIWRNGCGHVQVRWRDLHALQHHRPSRPERQLRPARDDRAIATESSGAASAADCSV